MIFPQPQGWVGDWAHGHVTHWAPVRSTKSFAEDFWERSFLKFMTLFCEAAHCLFWASSDWMKLNRERQKENFRRTARVLMKLFLNTAPPLYCQITKIKHFNHKFDILYWRENSSWTRGMQCLTSSGTLFLRNVWARASFIEWSNEETHDWLGGWKFPHKASRLVEE